MTEPTPDQSIRIRESAVGSAIVSGSGNTVHVIYQTQMQRQEPTRPDDSPKQIGPNPYKGLAAFQEQDSDRFFGREAQVARLWQRFRGLYEGNREQVNPRFLPILGPSGCGKSSLARAGLIPELARQAGQLGKEKLRVAVLVPGTRPVEALAGVLAKAATNDPIPVEKTEEFERVLLQYRGGEYDGLRRIASLIPDVSQVPLVILVDQFEEVYSLCEDPVQRQIFIDTLLHAANDPAGNVSVVVTFRSDFWGETQQHRQLNQVIGSDQSVNIPAMTEAELRRAVAEPAARAGHPLEDAVVDLLVKDTAGREGALPLLQFALMRIWEGLSEGRAAAETYREMDGVGGALAEKAQEIYDRLPEGDQDIARRVFVGLVQLGEGTRDTRRRVPLTELVTRRDSLKMVRRVIGRFSAPGARLITLSGDGGEQVAEVTHEALFDHWQLLKDWLNSGRDDIRFGRRLEAAAGYWDKQGRPEGLLWRSPDLELLKNFYERVAADMTPRQIAFHEKCIEVEARQKREKRRQRIGLIGSLTGGLIVSTGLGSWAFQNLQEVRRQSFQALIQAGKASLQRGENFDAVLTSIEAGYLHTPKHGSHSMMQLWSNIYQATQTAPWQDYYTLEDHSGPVWKVAFSPDGNTLATGGADGSVKLWRVSDGSLIISLDNHNSLITSLAFSPDGRTLATGSADSSVKLWRVSDGSLITSFDDHRDRVISLSFSPDGSTLATGSDDNSVKLWRISDSSFLIASLDDHKDSIRTLAFSPDGNTLATGSGDSSVKLWRVSDGSLITSLDDHKDSIRTLAFSPDGNTLATGGDDSSVKLWRIGNGSLITSLDDFSGVILSLVFSPDGSTLAAGGDNPSAKLWRISDRSLIASLDGHGDSITSLAFSPDGNTLATGGADSSTKLWRVDDGILTTSLDNHRGLITSLAFNPDGSTIATSSRDGSVKLWRTSDSSLITSLDNNPSGPIASLAFSPDSSTLAAGSNDVKLWRVDNGSLISSIDDHSNLIRALTFSPDGGTLATGGDDGSVELWRIGDGSSTTSLDDSDLINLLAFSPDGSTLATQGDDGVKLWRASNGSLISSIDDHSDSLNPLAFSPDGSTLATSSDDSSVKLWRVSNGSLISSIDDRSDSIASLAFSPDGSTLATSDYNSAKLWRVEDGSLIATLNDTVNPLAFSPDSKILAGASINTAAFVMLFRVSDGSLITPLDSQGDLVRSLAFSPNGSTLAVGSRFDGVKLWHVSNGSLITSMDENGSSISTLAFSPDGSTLATGSLDDGIKIYPLDFDAIMRYGCKWVGLNYIRNNPKMENRRHICNGFESE